MNVDEMMKRFEERNAGAVAEEAERARNRRILTFSRHDLILQALMLAAGRVLKRLGVPVERARADLVPDPETKKLVPKFTLITKDEHRPLDVDETLLQHELREEFRRVADEFHDDVAILDAYARAFPRPVVTDPDEVARMIQAAAA